jgi:hypothetical protein
LDPALVVQLRWVRLSLGQRPARRAPQQTLMVVAAALDLLVPLAVPAAR